MPGKPVKEFEKYLTTATGAHVSHAEYLESPAVALLRYLVEAKSSIDLCVRKFPTKNDGTYTKDSADSIQHLVTASLPSIMGHFETYQRYMFAGMFDLSVYMKDFQPSKFFSKLNKHAEAKLDWERVAAHRGTGASSIGLLLADALYGWHNPTKVNGYFECFGTGPQPFGAKDIKRLKVLWQLRHSIVHTGGSLTQPDSQKVDELKELGGTTIAFEHHFVTEVARKLHPLVRDATGRLEKKFRKNLLDSVPSAGQTRIDALFEVKSSVNVWLK